PARSPSGSRSLNRAVSKGREKANEGKQTQGDREERRLCSHRDAAGRSGDGGKRVVCIRQRRESRRMCLETGGWWTQLLFPSWSNARGERSQIASCEKFNCKSYGCEKRLTSRYSRHHQFSQLSRIFKSDIMSAITMNIDGGMTLALK
ncbi:Hypothetical protein SMAX5B_018383, partial [Scophthalmus maximus]